MDADNRLVLTGTVATAPSTTSSPTGIPHCEFGLEHQSQQMEAGMGRRAWCYLSVVASGREIQPQTLNLTKGSTARVIGFLSHHRTPNGVGKLVLHAQQIEMIA
ncbi:primosomal replication protein N [Corallincola platygyrae]|uniref:Replication restart protein PriB n=1 Tax=Corallincola platygyrae TaxID=1193278 RepID=A0ABW4XRT7_9GAMM